MLFVVIVCLFVEGCWLLQEVSVVMIQLNEQKKTNGREREIEREIERTRLLG